MSTATKPLDGRPLGAAIVVVALFVSDSGFVVPVALSKGIHDARYAAAPLRDAAGDGGVLERQRPFASRRGLTIGFTRGQIDAA